MKHTMKIQDVLNMPDGVEWLIDNQWDYELTKVFWKDEYWFGEKEHQFVAEYPSKDSVIFEDLECKLIILPRSQALLIHEENYVC